MAVYSPGNVEISTTISIGVIGVRVCPIEYLLFLSFFAPKKIYSSGDGDGDPLLPLALRCVPLPELERDPEPWV